MATKSAGGTTGSRQAAFQRVNEEIAHLAQTSADRAIFDDDVPWAFVCECGQSGCTTILKMRLADYREAHQSGRFVVAVSHVEDGDTIVSLGEHWAVVETADAAA